jgi:hypothetical protein
MYMIVPCILKKITEEGIYNEYIYQPLIIEDGVDYNLIKFPECSLEIWFGEDKYFFEDKDYVFSSNTTSEYLVVPFEKILYQ